jgi:hypothetical protein
MRGRAANNYGYERWRKAYLIVSVSPIRRRFRYDMHIIIIDRYVPFYRSILLSACRGAGASVDAGRISGKDLEQCILKNRAERTAAQPDRLFSTVELQAEEPPDTCLEKSVTLTLTSQGAQFSASEDVQAYIDSATSGQAGKQISAFRALATETLGAKNMELINSAALAYGEQEKLDQLRKGHHTSPLIKPSGETR